MVSVGVAVGVAVEIKFTTKALPKSICIEVDDAWDNEPNLKVSKRITRGSAQQVAALRKKSLCF